MKRSPFLPDSFVLCLGIFGILLLMFPSLRVAGVLALLLAAVYWLLMIVLTLVQRQGQ